MKVYDTQIYVFIFGHIINNNHINDKNALEQPTFLAIKF